MARRARLIVLSTAIVLSALPAPLAAHGRHRSRGFEPSDATLACIRGPWGRHTMESGGDYGATNGRFRGAYQIGTSEWRAWGRGIWVDLEGTIYRAEAYNGRHQHAPALLQDGVARVGIRARGLQPWPKPNRICPRP